MPDKRRGKRGDDKKRARFRHAAYRCFRDRGYHETTVQTICMAAGTSKGSFYWHYPSKQALFIEILETWAREIMLELFEQFEEPLSSEDYVPMVTEAIHREIHRGKAIVPLWLEFALHARNEDEIRDALAKFFSRARVALTEMLRPQVHHRLSEEELRGVTTAIFGAYLGVVLQELVDSEGANAADTGTQLVALISRLVE